MLNLQYRLFHADELFVEGSTDDDVIIAARGRQTIPLRVTVPFAGVLRAVEDIRPGEVLPYRAELGLTVDTPATSGELLLADHQGELPIPAAPDIEVRSLAWESLTLNSARAAMTLDITNTNSFPVGVQTLQGGLTLAGMRVADLRVAEAVSLEPGAQAELKIPVSFSPLRFGAAFFRSLTGSDDMSYALDGTLDVRTPWGEHLWPLLATGEADFE